MPPHDADRNLLFGITALQNDFITRDALIAAMGAWALAKHRPIGDILVEARALDPGDRDALEAMIARRLAKHQNDPAASLAALSSAGSLGEALRRSIADPDILASVAQIPGDAYATRAGDPHELLPPGTRYRKVREHAAGNLGVVYVAHDQELNRDVALKEIKERNADHPHNQAKFLLEAEVTGGLEHPGIVPVYGLGHHQDGRPYYAMRFIRGKSLLDAIKKFHADESLKKDSGKRLLELQKLLRRFTDVCNAIAYAHSRGVLHRDLKPDNVMVGKYGETLVVDWGLAKALGTSGESTATILDHDDPLPEASLQPSSTDGMDETHAGALVGTPAYMSPEQAAGRLDLLGPASDIYGLGATLYHLIVGRLPIEATTIPELFVKIQAGEITPPRTLAPWLDPALEAICLKAMALRPEMRFSSPRALAEDIECYLADEPVTALPETISSKIRRWLRRNPTKLPSVAFFAANCLIVNTLAFWIFVLGDNEFSTQYWIYESIQRFVDGYYLLLAAVLAVIAGLGAQVGMLVGGLLNSIAPSIARKSRGEIFQGFKRGALLGGICGGIACPTLFVFHHYVKPLDRIFSIAPGCSGCDTPQMCSTVRGRGVEPAALDVARSPMRDRT